MNPAIHRRVALFAYPGFDLLDLGATVAVFRAATVERPGAYDLQVVSPVGGDVESSSGVTVASERAGEAAIDTLVVMGGAAKVVTRPTPDLLDPLIAAASASRRVASTCTGAFLLAHAALLDGRRATTHWAFAAELKARFPAVRVDSDRIFVNDGPVWTSAGGTAAIDLALALVEQDLGTEMSRLIARKLVVYHRRLGGQSQFSALLDLDPPSERIKRALSFAREHLHERLPVSRLAQAAHLSERQFGRAFVAETGMTPARAIERLRSETARPMVEDGRQPLDVIARSVGFSDPEQMRQAFVRAFGQPPQAVRRLSRAAARPGIVAL